MRARVTSAVCALLMLLAGCSSGEPQAEPTTSAPREPGTPTRTLPSYSRPTQPPTTGPQPAWTLYAEGDDEVAAEVVAVGNVVVLRSPELVRAVRRTGGRDVWRRESGERARFQSVVPTAGGLAVVAGNETGRVSVEVLDPATGKSRWRSGPADHLAVYRDAVYLDDCRTDQDPCTLTARATLGGKVLWRTPSGHSLSVESRTIGWRPGVAPAAGPRLAARLWSAEQSKPQFAAIETATGRLLDGRLPASDWYGVVSDDLLVAIDPGDGGATDCSVRISAVGVEGGGPVVSSPELTIGVCRRLLKGPRYGPTLPDAGGRFAVLDGRFPVLYDVESGESVRTGSDPGVPLDADSESVLVRDSARSGGLSLLDAGNGRRRWTADDPGLDPLAPGWRTMLTGRLVVVGGSTGSSTRVLVYDEESGRLRGRYDGEPVGAGGDWVAISSPGSLELITF